MNIAEERLPKKYFLLQPPSSRLVVRLSCKSMTLEQLLREEEIL